MGLSIVRVAIVTLLSSRDPFDLVETRLQLQLGSATGPVARTP
jgi:hypothetical protein